MRDDEPQGISELELYGLSIRTIERLDDHGYVWIDDLQELTAEEFLGWAHAGEKMLAELRAALQNYLDGRMIRTVDSCVWFDRSGSA